MLNYTPGNIRCTSYGKEEFNIGCTCFLRIINNSLVIICLYVASNQTFASNKTFISWMLNNSDKSSAVSGSWNPGTCALIPEGAVSTDKCYRTVQHSSTVGLIDMQWHQLQGSPSKQIKTKTQISLQLWP